MKKKVFLVLGICAIAVFVTGCNAGKSTLVCKQTTSGVDITFNVGFTGNKIDTMDFDYDMDLSKYSDNYISAIEKQDFCTSVKNSMSAYKDAFTDCKQTVVDKKLKVSSVLDVNKLTKSVLDQLTSPEKAKKDLEKEGYTCTINK